MKRNVILALVVGAVGVLATSVALVPEKTATALVLAGVSILMLLLAAILWKWERLMAWLAEQLPIESNAKDEVGVDAETEKRQALNLIHDELLRCKRQLDDELSFAPMTTSQWNEYRSLVAGLESKHLYNDIAKSYRSIDELSAAAEQDDPLLVDLGLINQAKRDIKMTLMLIRQELGTGGTRAIIHS